MNLTELLVRVAVFYITLLLLARIAGRQEISQMTFFNFISSIAIGSIAANMIINPDVSIRNGVIALAGWTAFTILMEFIDIKSRTMRMILDGNPIVVVQNGKILDRSLRKVRLDIDTLQSMLRQQNVFSMKDVQYAIYETNGQLSVLRKSDTQTGNATIPLATQVISDGNILFDNLEKLNLTEAWLKNELKRAGIHSVDEVFFAEVQQDGTLYADKKERMVH